MNTSIAAVVLGLCCCAAGARDHSSDRSDAQAMESEHATRLTAFIVEWNALAYRLAYEEDQFATFKGQRALAMMHLAQHDALNAISPRFERYLLKARAARADAVSASAYAAREVLMHEYPAASADIEALLAEQLASIQPGWEKISGMRIGATSGQRILRARRNDGWATEGSYSFDTRIGAYQTTPDWRGFVLHPGLADAKPFFLPSSAHFRPDPPPHVESLAYARAFQEVRKQGGSMSTHRTPEETRYAIWWMEFSEGLANRYARAQVVQRRLDAWKTARLFALMNAALVDAYVAVWESKYEFNHWRPYTAIREAGRDRNPLTQPDTTWESLRPAPPFPEYVSAHAAGCACTLSILEKVFGHGSVTLESLTAPDEQKARHFASFDAAADECADSRVQIGFHFRYSTDAGQLLGRRVARYSVNNYLKAL